MPEISQVQVQALLCAGVTSQSKISQGKALEELICYLFSQIPGITVTRRNEKNAFQTEEIDVAFWNEKHPDGLFFLPYIILVECKNWVDPVSSEQISWFDTKLRSRGLSFGILVAANGVTGNPAFLTASHSIIAGALREQRQIVVLSNTELLTLEDTKQLVHLMKEKLCDLAVKGTSF